MKNKDILQACFDQLNEINNSIQVGFKALEKNGEIFQSILEQIIISENEAIASNYSSFDNNLDEYHSMISKLFEQENPSTNKNLKIRVFQVPLDEVENMDGFIQNIINDAYKEDEDEDDGFNFPI